MLKLLPLSILMFFMSVACLATQNAGGKHTIEVDGKARLYKIYIPKKYDAKKATPLVIALHGGGGNMDIQSNDEYYKLISKAEQTGHIIAFPNGFSRFRKGKLATWNAGQCCGPARDKKSNDAGFILAMIEKIKSTYNVDSKKIYAIGMSNGGMMAYRMACEHAEVFSGIASVTGTDNTIGCHPKKAINILHIHALDDDHVKFHGGRGKSAAKASQVNDFVSVPATISKWVSLNKCLGKPKRTLEVKGAYCERYDQCQDGVRVELCVTQKGGHSWPGGKKPRSKEQSQSPISANDIIWSSLGID